MRAFTIYGLSAEDSSGIYDKHDRPNMVFDVEWKAGAVDLLGGVRDERYELVAVFSLKSSVGARWLQEGQDKLWLVVGHNIYSAEDVMNGKASEFVEQIWAA